MRQLLAVIIGLLIATSATAKTLEINDKRAIYLSGPVGQNSFGIANKIEELAKTDEDIYMIINSPGGEVVVGYLIINAMNVAKQRGVKFICHTSQLSASMAFQVFANCDKRYALPGTYLLFHPVRISAEITLTPKLARQLYFELRQIEKRMTAELLAAMNVSYKFFEYHYLAESLWTASQFNESVPGFLTIVDSVTGLKDGYQQFELRQSIFDGGTLRNRGYKFIYQSPYTLDAISQP
jgi:ATP-dependent protease ClpP protease subunit